MFGEPISQLARLFHINNPIDPARLDLWVMRPGKHGYPQQNTGASGIVKKPGKQQNIGGNGEESARGGLKSIWKESKKSAPKGLEEVVQGGKRERFKVT